jgi:hypothetical protein
MALEFQVSMDCADPHAQCEFWAGALGYEVEPSDPAFIKRMIAEGHATEAQTAIVKGELRWKDGAACSDPEGKHPRMYFQLVPEEKAGKNRVHLDVRTPDKAAAVERLTGLGARTLYEESQGPHSWITMADPEGNEFCVS